METFTLHNPHLCVVSYMAGLQGHILHHITPTHREHGAWLGRTDTADII